MKIQLNNYYGINYYQSVPSYNQFTRLSAPIDNKSDCDRFEMTAFTGEKTNRKESKRIEQTLKSIDGLHDPYSDVIMISTNRFKGFQKKIQRCQNAESGINILAGYTEHMFDSEKEIYDLFRKETAKAKKEGRASNLTFSDILQEHLPEAKERLINSQLNVTESIRQLAKKKLNKEDKEYVDLYLSIIDKDILNDRFRIKPSKQLLSRLENELDDKQTAKEIMKLAKNFPSTATNADAFIVKNAYKSNSEIGELLISPAKISIEHIKPSSIRGESKGDNYLAASTRMNNYRSSTPLPELIEEYPDIPLQTQQYFDDLIAKVNRGGLSDISVLIPDVKERLFKESGGLIDVDISELRPEIMQKRDIIKHKIDELVEHFNKNKE